MSEFSMELNDDQLQVLTWVHDFAANVMRPAAPEWDEREETPWPIIEEASRIGLYSFDFVANCFADPTGLLFPLVNEEMAWGDAGIALALLGSTLGVAAIVAAGTPEQVAEWAPRCFGQTGDVRLTALCVSEVDTGSDLGSMHTRAVYDATRDTWTINGTKTWITNGGVADIHVVVASAEPDLGTRGQASFVVPPKTPGLSMGRKLQKTGMHASHTAEVVLKDVTVPGTCLLGGKDRFEERVGRARKVSQAKSSLHHGDAGRDAPGRRRAGGRDRARRLRVHARLCQAGAELRASDHRTPSRRLQACGHEDPRRRRALALHEGGLDGDDG